MPASQVVEPSDTTIIEVFADVSCPFAHVGLHRLIERRDEIKSHALIHIRAWPLELVNGHPLSGSLVAQKVAALRSQVAPDLFKGFDAAHFPTTTLPAMALEVAAYRRSPELGEHVSAELRDAVFEGGRDLSRPETIADIGREHDLVITSADEAAVIESWHEGQRRGVEGSPYFFVEGRGYFCPSLVITHIGDQLLIKPAETIGRFLELALH